MLVDDIGDVTITNDGATILMMLEVEHPAAKVCAQFYFFTLYFPYIYVNYEFLHYMSCLWKHRCLLSWQNYKTGKLETGQLPWSS